MTDSSDQYFVRFRGRTLGPLPAQRVQELVRRGQITRLHELSPDGLSWSKAETFDSLFRRPAPQPASSSTAQALESQTSTSGAEPATPQPLTAKAGSTADPEVQWYAHVGEESRGPVSTQKLMEWIDGGVVDRTTLVWRAGFDSWQPAEQSLPQRFSPQSASSGNGHSYARQGVDDFITPRGGSHDWTMVAAEMNRRRGWAMFCGVLMVTISSIQMLIQLVALIAAAGNSATRAEAYGATIGALSGLAVSGPVLYAGVLLIRYCNEVAELHMNPNHVNTVKALKRLSSLWIFCGITSLVWTVIVVIGIILIFAMGFAVLNAFS